MGTAVAVVELAEIATKINSEHEAACGSADKAMKHAAECGRALIEAKKLFAHGEWLPWLEANTGVDERQSQKYMRLATHWPEIEKRTGGTYLGGINDALKLIAKPSRKPKPGVPIEVHDDEPDDDEGDESSRRQYGLANCCDQAKVAAEDALHHIERGTIDAESLLAIWQAHCVWERVYELAVEKRGATLPQDGRSEVAVVDATPPNSAALFAKLEAELKKGGDIIGDMPPELVRKKGGAA